MRFEFPPKTTSRVKHDSNRIAWHLYETGPVRHDNATRHLYEVLEYDGSMAGFKNRINALEEWGVVRTEVRGKRTIGVALTDDYAREFDQRWPMEKPWEATGDAGAPSEGEHSDPGSPSPGEGNGERERHIASFAQQTMGQRQAHLQDAHGVGDTWRGMHGPDLNEWHEAIHQHEEGRPEPKPTVITVEPMPDDRTGRLMSIIRLATEALVADDEPTPTADPGEVAELKQELERARQSADRWRRETERARRERDALYVVTQRLENNLEAVMRGKPATGMSRELAELKRLMEERPVVHSDPTAS